MVERGAFRADLLHRIAAMRIRLPALHERVEDVPRLAAHFLTAEGLEPSVSLVELLMKRRWAGNVRELRHALAMAAAVAQKDSRNEVRTEDLSFTESAAEADPSSLRTRLARALAAADGNVTRAAQDLGMARSGFYEALRRLNLDPATFRKG
jgi:transcriptional regulator of acetoin/glycerol metabolism